MGDNATLKATSILGGDAGLIIYAQSTGDNAGTLNITDSEEASIFTGGSVTINGGQVTVTSENGDAYILGGGDVTINGGNVTVTSTSTSENGDAYILGGGDVTINGGNVTVTSTSTSENSEAYIGGNNVTIKGGQVNVKNTGENGKAYIEGSNGVEINGGQVNVTSENRNAYIVGSNGNVTINGGQVTVTSENRGAYIDGSNVTINGEQVNVTSKNGYANIEGSNVTINGGQVTVTSENGYANIEGYSGVTIKGGTVNVKGKGTASISGSSGVTIDGGTVTVEGEGSNSGIMCGTNGSITLGYTNQDDFIQASDYSTTPTIATDKTFAVMKGEEFTELEKFITRGTDNGKAAKADGTTVGPSELKGKKLVPAVTVTFDANNGTGTMDTQYVRLNTEGTLTLTENTFTRSGYTFKGWNTAQNGGGQSYEDGATIALTKNVTLYAQWQQQSQETTPPAATLSTIEVSVTGEATLTTTEGTAATSAYTASVTGKYSDGTSKTLSASDYSLTWTLDKDISGISINNGTLSVNDSVSAGGYTLRITATATQGSVTGSGSQSVNITVSEKQQEETTPPAVTLSTIEVSVTGALTLTTTEGTATTSAYTASVTGKYSDGTSAALTDYSIEWTLDKNISGIQISNNGTLSVNDSVKAGTYALTITARATKDSVTGSGTRSVNLTVNAQKQEEQQQEEQQQEEQPAETAALESLGVSITGSDNLIVKEQETLTSTYTASVTGTYSDSTTKTLAAGDYSLEWTLEPNITGVSVSDGTLRVSDRALAGKYTFTITVKATHDSITGSLTKGVNLEVLERRKTIDAEYLENMTTEEKNAVEYLALSDNPDKQIADLSQIDFSDFTNLNTLDLSELKNLDEADLSQLPENVKTVNLEKTNITSLNLNGSTVEKVNANGCKNLMNIDAEDNESLTDLDVSDTSITVINVKNCTNLQTLNCSSCDLEAGNLNLEGCTNLVSLDISRNHFGWFDYDPSNLSSMNYFDCHSQDMTILESTTAFNFGQFFNSGDITVAGVRVMASAYIGSIGNVTAYNESGDSIASDYDPQTGVATFESAPDVIKYLYDTGFDDLSMDVTINALTHTEEQEQEPEAGYNPSLGSSGGSCNVGLSLSSLLFAVFLFVKKR